MKIFKFFECQFFHRWNYWNTIAIQKQHNDRMTKENISLARDKEQKVKDKVTTDDVLPVGKQHITEH